MPELRSVIAAVGANIEGPLATIREQVEPRLATIDPKAAASPHLATALAMCDDVSELTRRYLEYIDQAEALSSPLPGAERPDELVGEVDRRVMPDAFGRGVAWGCTLEGPIRPIWTDRVLCLEALVEWASLAVASARPGDSVSLVVAAAHPDAGRIRLTLHSSAEELIADLASLRDDPLFNRAVCLDEVGTDPGSRLALSLERLLMLDVEVSPEAEADGRIRAVHFRFPVAAMAGQEATSPGM